MVLTKFAGALLGISSVSCYASTKVVLHVSKYRIALHRIIRTRNTSRTLPVFPVADKYQTGSLWMSPCKARTCFKICTWFLFLIFICVCVCVCVCVCLSVCFCLSLLNEFKTSLPKWGYFSTVMKNKRKTNTSQSGGLNVGQSDRFLLNFESNYRWEIDYLEWG